MRQCKKQSRADPKNLLSALKSGPVMSSAFRWRIPQLVDRNPYGPVQEEHQREIPDTVDKVVRDSRYPPCDPGFKARFKGFGLYEEDNLCGRA